MIKQIITHSGQFHADEVFAIALLRQLFGDIPVERTRDISTELIQDPEVWVLDVGKIFDPEISCFDHHQNKELPATNMLVLNHLISIQKIGNDLYDRLKPSFIQISEIDLNGYTDTNGFQVNSLIKSYNSLYNGFERALEVASSFVEAQMINVLVEFESRRIFDKSEPICFMTKLSEEFPVFWKSYKECTFLVSKDQSGEWCLHTIDAKEFPLVPTGKEKFFHNGKFIAVYNSKEDAISSARIQCINTFG